MVRIRVLRKIGPEGQIVIPKIMREYLGVKPGDTVILEVREGDSYSSWERSKRFVEDFCSVVKDKLAEEIDLDRLVEREVEERFALR